MNTDLFGGGDAVVKYVLEGHDRGVNWAAFHPVCMAFIQPPGCKLSPLAFSARNSTYDVSVCPVITLVMPLQSLAIAGGADQRII
jgi:hypothetical protein